VSCGKAGQVFAEEGVEIDTECDAKKEAIAEAQAWPLLSGAENVYVASGQNVLVYQPGPDCRDELMARVIGRSGNLRAPTIRLGNRFYVGFNERLYEDLLKAKP